MATWDFFRRLLAPPAVATELGSGAAQRQERHEPPSDADLAELRRTRTIHLAGEIDDACATLVIAKLLFLRDDAPTQPVVVDVDSLGGNVVAGFAIVDAISEAPEHTHTSCVSSTAGIASLILAAGTRGSRSLGPNARVAIGPLYSPRRDDPVVRGELARMEAELVRLLTYHTRQPLVVVLPDVRAGRSFNATDAVSYGFADAIR